MDVDSTVIDIAPKKTVTIQQALGDRIWQVSIIVSLAALIAVYWRTFGWWWGKWMEEESYYSHAILIPFMSAFVIYINRKTLADVRIRPSLWGLVLLIPAIGLELLGHMGNTGGVMGLTLPITLLGAIILLFGFSMTRQLMFPTLFLFFMCVLPGFILTRLSFKIQLMSTTVATHMLNLAQMHAQQNGTQISLPNVEVIVGAPCSGFRMLISLLAFAVFFAYMKEGPRWGRIALIAFTAPLSLIANSLRVAMIAVVGEFIGVDAMHTFHDYSGFIVLAVAFIVLWWLAKVVKCDKFKNMQFS